MNVLLVEDEQPAQQKLKAILKEIDASISIAGVLESGKDIRNWFGMPGNEADLVISDIQLLDGVAFNAYMDVDINIPVIFLTAYNEYMLEAFRSKGIAYVTKPYDKADLEEALKKYDELRKSMTKSEYRELASMLKEARQDVKYAKRLLSRKNQKIEVVQVKEVAYFQIKDGIITAFSNGYKRYPLSITTLNELEEQLNPDRFFRINRGEIINIDFVEHFEQFYKDRLSVSLKGTDQSLITSNSRSPDFRNWISGKWKE